MNVKYRCLLSDEQLYRLSNGMAIEKKWYVGDIWSLGQKLIVIQFPPGHPDAGRTAIVKADSNDNPVMYTNLGNGYFRIP